MFLHKKFFKRKWYHHIAPWQWFTGVFVVLCVFIILAIHSLAQQKIYPLLLEGETLTPLSAEFFQELQEEREEDLPKQLRIKQRQFPKMTAETMFDPLTFSAESMIVKDVETGAVLYEKNAYDRRAIASITKLMTALIVLEKGPDWDKVVTVVGGDSLGTHMYAGDTYSIDTLFRAGLIGSSNKAMVTLSQSIDLPKEAFIERMNERALELGMGARFLDPTGLNPGNEATASDIAILLAEAMRHEKIKAAVGERQLNLYSNERASNHNMWNTNWLLLGWIPHNFPVLHGGKTGYIPAAGYNFTVRLEGNNGHMIDVVVLGAENYEARFTEARDIAEWVFDSYDWPEEAVTEKEVAIL